MCCSRIVSRAASAASRRVRAASSAAEETQFSMVQELPSGTAPAGRCGPVHPDADAAGALYRQKECLKFQG
eukprot:4843315-Prorocentrum_lima.AAC.1